MLMYKDWTKNEWKKQPIFQRKTLKDLQKAWRNIPQVDFKRLQESLATWKKI